MTVKFLLDENMRGWIEIHDWLTSTAIGNEKEHPVLPYKDRFSDITLNITNSAYKNKFQVIFRNAFPISLSQIPFSVQSNDTTPITITTSFKYAYYDFNVLTSS